MAACSVEDVLAKAEREEAEKLKSIAVTKELELEFDVGNLLALDKNPAVLRDPHRDREELLRALARDNAQLLVNEIWKLPAERADDVLVVKLPEPSTRLPREKPPPKARPPTKWEQFAKLKGIQKKKKTNLVWDEVHKEWRRRWGYKRAKDDTKEWLIEVPETTDPNEDQFAKRNKAKKERVAKNEFNRLRNIARATKTKVPGVGLAPRAQQSKNELAQAISVAKTATASVGKFQERLPKEKGPKNTGKKRKFQPLLGDFSSEKQKQLELLKVLESKRPRVDITKAVNKQMREEEEEEGRARRSRGVGKKGRGGKGIAAGGKGKGKGSKGPKGGKGSKGGKGRNPRMKQGKR
ncbi:ribosome biogenesis regulatory protein homolog [Pygocentrus nattereri]|uniref:Ribosome biogenesis regulatory protein n=1 Tax=Pygocentrus nattereri TaxID=42514 RepID=A0A3B4CWB2_PYGNA|nr:ribosome biogenesis regulatory protein homolog [Pygocentrus nattereri]